MIDVSAGTSKPAILRDLGGRLSDALRIHGPVRRDQQLAERVRLLRRCRSTPCAAFSSADDAVAQRVLGDDGLLARADGAVVEAICRRRSSAIASSRSAEVSTSTGTLPGPTPNAGLPLEYAAFTMPAPPVERITPVRSCRISALVPSMVARVDALDDVFGRAGFERRLIQDRRPSRRCSCSARGCGLMTIALPALSEISVL